MNTIGISEIKAQLDLGESLKILDVRSRWEFAASHARGAHCIPLDELTASGVSAWTSTTQDPVLLICQSGSRAKAACLKLEKEGMTNALVIEGGTLAWERAGLPMEYGQKRSISVERQVRIVAGSLVAICVLLGWFANPWWNVGALAVGLGLVFAGITDFCGMGLLLAKMPWNRE